MQIPIVNEQDEIIGYKDKTNRDHDDIIRVSGLWVVDENGLILLQRRSLNKKSQPGVWQIAVAGTVESSETYETNILKEMQEEIGLVGVPITLGPKFRFFSDHNFFAQMFLANVPHDYSFKIEPREIMEIRWFAKEELEKFIEDNPTIVSPNLKEIVTKILYANQS